MELIVLAIGTFATIVIGIAGLILQHIGNKHFAEQNRLMTPGTRKVSTPIPFNPPRWPLVVMTIMVVVVWSAVGILWLNKSYAPPTSKEWTKYQKSLEPIVSKTFSDQEVETDGKDFNNCHFQNVALIYRGKRPVFVGNSTLANTHLKIVKGPQSDGASTLLGVLMDTCRGKESSCDVRAVLSWVEVVDEDGHIVPAIP